MKREGLRGMEWDRRQFIKRGATAAFGLTAIPLGLHSDLPGGRSVAVDATGNLSEEILYNGIRIPAVWPPANMEPGIREPMPVPYLENPPKVIPVDFGRQLFVDGFLIETTTLSRTFHQAEKYEGNPVIMPEAPWEKTGSWHHRHIGFSSSSACPFDDGVFYDPSDNLFKMWYMAGTLKHTCLAVSEDGIQWERPDLGVVRGTNIVFPYDPSSSRDSFSPWLDFHSEENQTRYKSYLFTRDIVDGKRRENHRFFTSPDGVHWNFARSVDVGLRIWDGTVIFYNPFRKKWVLNMKRHLLQRGRCRAYHEGEDFFSLAQAKNPVFWVGADRLDLPEPGWVTRQPTQLYALAVNAYESLMLGAFSIHYGPENPECFEQNLPKLTQIKLGFSRDGFHWDRPFREAFIPATMSAGDWDRAYLRAAGGGYVTVGDRLHFYYCGFSGKSPRGEPDMYAGGSTHLAILRRDGFASMDAGGEGGTLTTRPVRFKGRYLFVNVDCPRGMLKAEILDRDGNVISPFGLDNAVPLSADSTAARLIWNGRDNLSDLRGTPVRFRFHLTRGKLYAFWVSPEESGASHGYVASGPGMTGGRDTAGGNG